MNTIVSGTGKTNVLRNGIHELDGCKPPTGILSRHYEITQENPVCIYAGDCRYI